MAMPYQIWLVLLTFSVLTTMYALMVWDKLNYTDAIAGVLGTIFWFISGLSILIGVQAEDMMYQSSVLMWIFVAIGIIIALLTIVRIFDIINERKERKNHVHFTPIRL